MEIEKTFVLPAPPARVWAMLLDPQLMAACVPGMQSVEVLSPTEYTAQIQVKIAFITARFKLRTTIVEQRAPEYLRTEGTGEDTSVASALKQTSELFLTDLGDGRTELRTRVLVDVTGRLGSFGLSVMKTKADRMWEEFCANLVQRVGEAAGTAGASTASTAEPAAAPTAAGAAHVAPAPTPAPAAVSAPKAGAASAEAPGRGPVESLQTPTQAPHSATESVPAAAAASGVNTERTAARPPVQQPQPPARGWWARLLGSNDAAVPTAAGAHHIRIELRKEGTVLTVDWPVQASADCATWLREVTRG